MARAWRGLGEAIAFLTIVPVSVRDADRSGAGLADSVAWFPLVGAAVGALAGAVRLGGEALFGRPAGTVLALIALVTVTGALHQDGLADTADGLGVRGDPARRLAAMRDSSTGAFGVLALIGWALLLYAALGSLDGDRALRALIAAGAASRLALLVHGFGSRPARSDGLGAGFAVAPAALGVAAVLCTAIVLVAVGLSRGVLSLGLAACLAALSAVFVRRAIGGRTGDTLGACAALVEAAVCLGLVASWHG